MNTSKIRKLFFSIGIAGMLFIGSAIPAFATVAYPAEGGTWNYGSETVSGQKHGWSHYVHPSRYHSATAIVGSSNPKAWANANYWADADAYGGTGNIAYAYYGF